MNRSKHVLDPTNSSFRGAHEKSFLLQKLFNDSVASGHGSMGRKSSEHPLPMKPRANSQFTAPHTDYYYQQQRDLNEIKRSESDNVRNKQKNRLYRYLVFIFAMACIRNMLLGFCDVSNAEARVTANIRDTLISRKSFIAGYLIFGNLADNAYDPKMLLVICLTATACYYIVSAIMLYSASLSEESKV